MINKGFADIFHFLFYVKGIKITTESPRNQEWNRGIAVYVGVGLTRLKAEISIGEGWAVLGRKSRRLVIYL